MLPHAKSLSWLYELGKLSVEMLDNWPHTLAALADEIRGRAPESPLVLKFRNGLELELMPGGVGGYTILFPEIFARAVYEPPEFTFPPAPTMIDLGANVGFFTCKMAQSFPKGRVIAVEAMPAYVELLRKNLARNRLENVQVVPCAVGPDDTSVEIEYWYTSTGYLKVSAPPAGAPSQRASVRAASLATVLQTSEVDQCDLLKLDIEGHEYAVLGATPDAVLRRCRQIAMEWHRASGGKADSALNDLLKRLSQAGFEFLSRSNLAYGKGRATGMLYAVRK